ncbi:MAG: hypothetical protein ACJ735_08705 [Actinomycetes bacterium]
MQFRMQFRKTLGLTAGAALLAVTGAACGGSSDNGVAKKTPDQIIAAMKAALNKNGSFHVAGSGKSGGSGLGVDLNIDAKKNAAVGSLTVNGQRLDLVRIGSAIYIKAPAAFFQAQGAPAAAATAFDNKWLKSTTSSKSFSDLSDVTTVDGFLKPDGPITKGSASTLHGKKVLALVDSKGTSDEGTLYVQTTGDPLPVQIVSGGSDSGTLVFDKFGETVTATAPAAAVDLSNVGG